MSNFDIKLDTQDRTTQRALLALQRLTYAYGHGNSNKDPESVDWEDVDAAHEMAREVLEGLGLLEKDLGDAERYV